MPDHGGAAPVVLRSPACDTCGQQCTGRYLNQWRCVRCGDPAFWIHRSAIIAFAPGTSRLSVLMQDLREMAGAR